jgi:drug/metabolite transporter (DMT)-like permease
MPAVAVALILVSCVLHALWNFLIKRAQDKLAFTALYLTSAVVMYSPLLLIHLKDFPLPPGGWACIFGTGIVYFVYFVCLGLSYQHGELSVAYPLSRGLGPALAFLGGIAFFGESPSFYGSVGVSLILCGVIALNWQGGLSKSGGNPLRNLPLRVLLPALTVGLMYCFYSLIDKTAVGKLRIPPPLYLCLTFTMAALLVVPWIIRKQGMDALREEWRINAKSCVWVGALNLFAYLLILYAMSLPHTPVGYVVPLRTTSVLFGVLLGVKALGEERLPAKLTGAVLMMTGIAMTALKG